MALEANSWAWVSLTGSEPHILQRQQGRIAAGARRVGAGRPLRAEAGEVVGAPGLGAGAGEALAAEGLRADDGADHRAVDIEVADGGQLLDRLGGAGDAAVEAHGEAEAGTVDPFHRLGQPARLPGG